MSIIKKLVIIISALILVAATYSLIKNFVQQDNSGSGQQQISQNAGDPIDNTAIKDAIRNTEKTTRCLLTNASNISEYHINGENILVKNTTLTEGSNINFYTLKLDSEVYIWDSSSSSATTFTIPTAEQINNNPSLNEYIKLTPNTNLLDSEGVAELQDQGYQVSCELIDNSLSIFKTPDIVFSYLRNPPTSEPNSTQ